MSTEITGLSPEEKARFLQQILAPHVGYEGQICLRDATLSADELPASHALYLARAGLSALRGREAVPMDLADFGGASAFISGTRGAVRFIGQALLKGERAEEQRAETNDEGAA